MPSREYFDFPRLSNEPEHQPMPSNVTHGDELEAYAAHFEQDVLQAAAVLGWEMVNRIIADAKASR